VWLGTYFSSAATAARLLVTVKAQTLDSFQLLLVHLGQFATVPAAEICQEVLGAYCEAGEALAVVSTSGSEPRARLQQKERAA